MCLSLRTKCLDVTSRRFSLPCPSAVRRTLCAVPPCSHSRPLVPHSAYYYGPPPPDSAYGTDPVGQIGVHHPREIVRIERDYSGGELPQFAPTYPLELEGRVSVLIYYRLSVLVTVLLTCGVIVEGCGGGVSSVVHVYGVRIFLSFLFRELFHLLGPLSDEAWCGYSCMLSSF